MWLSRRALSACHGRALTLEIRVNRRVLHAATSLLLGLAVAGCSQSESEAPTDSAALDDVRTVEIDDARHVDGPVDYDEALPLGGPHNPAWANCGFYGDEAVPNEFAVHSMEHGAVWIAYPEETNIDTEALRDLVVGQSHVLVSPSPDADQLTATAWGAQIELGGVDDPALPAFIEAYVQGPQTPEPGAACSGGVGEPS